MDLDFKSIFESVPELYLVVLPNPPLFTIVAVSNAYAKQTLTRREHILGRPLFDIFPDNPNEPHSDGVRNLNASLLRVIETQREDAMAVQKYDIRTNESENSKFEERFWSPTNIPILKNGRLEWILHRVEDVTDFVRAQDREHAQASQTEEFKNRIIHMEKDIIRRGRDLQKANEKLKAEIQLREDVLAIVSHDLRNPLSSIEMSTDLMREVLTRPDLQCHLTLIQIQERSIRQMKRLISDLLTFAKIQSGNLTVELAVTSLEKLAEESVQHVLHYAIKKKIEIVKEVRSTTDFLLCDHDRLLEVLANLLGNAVKFSPPESKVSLRISEEPGFIHFTISDQGSGIEPEHIPHIFDRYWQAQRTARLGTGLGLAIAKGLVESHQGKIWVESKLHEGAQFHFKIPTRQPIPSQQTQN